MPGPRQSSVEPVAGEPTLPVASVARRLGVAPATLRTWDRRYGLGPSKHTDGRHRRYGARDIERLELMQRALLRGASTAEAARYALDQVPVARDGTTRSAASEPSFAGHEKAVRTSLHINTVDGAVVLAAERSAAGASRLARLLSAAVLEMDVRSLQRVLAEAITDHGAVGAWQNIISPVVSAVGAGWQSAKAGTEASYLLAECVLAALIRATPVLAEPRNQRPVLLGTVPDERETLPLYALAAGFAERGINGQLVGTGLPANVLSVAVRRSAPAAVVLWARGPGVADPRLFATVARGRQRGRLFAAGVGWAPDELPGKVELLADLPTAVDRVEYVLLGARNSEEPE